MPMEWYAILSIDGIDKVSTLQKLKYELTVADVHDLLEINEVDKFLKHEERRLSKGNNNNASS